VAEAATRTTAMFTLVKQLTDQRLYRWKSLLLNIHWNEFRVEHFKAINDACALIVGEHQQMSSIVVMRGQFHFDLSPEARRAGAALTKEWEGFNTGQAIIIEADGFKASLARSLITGVNLLARSKAKQKVFKDPREATQWVCALDNQIADVRTAMQPTWSALDQMLADLPS
jgi:hypothetical protein